MLTMDNSERSFFNDEAANLGQSLWVAIITKMNIIQKYRLYQTEISYLGITPRPMRSGDSISVFFCCRSLLVLNSTGSYHRHLVLCFDLSFEEGEAIQEMVHGSKVMKEFQIH